MPTTHTLVIGAGQAGLAVSRCLADADVDHVVLERGRVAERWRSRALGLAPAPHPELDEPAPRLELPGPDARRLHDRGRARRLPRPTTPARFAAPVDERQRRSARLERDRRAASPSRTDRRAVAGRATSSSPPAGATSPRVPALAAPARPGDRPGHRRRRTATPTSCPTAACSSSARRPPACSSPTSSPAPAATSCWPSAATAGCRGATAAWTSAGGSTRSARFARTIDEVADPAAARRERVRCSSSAGPTTATSTCPPSKAGRRLAGRLVGVDGARVGFADDLAGHRRRRRRSASRGSSTRSTATSTRPAWAPRCSPPTAAASGRPHRADRRARPPRRAASARSSGPPGSPRPYPWLHVPVLDQRGEIPQRRGITPARRAVRARPALPAPPRLQLHRRRAPRRRPRRRPHRQPAPVPRAHRLLTPRRAHARGVPTPRGPTMRTTPPPHRHDVVVVGARAAGAATALLLARAGLDVLVVDRSRYGADTLSTHALMRAGVVQLHRWGLLDAVVAAGTPAVRTTTFRYADDERHGAHQARPRRRRALRAAAHRARPDPRRRGPSGRRRRSATA